VSNLDANYFQVMNSTKASWTMAKHGFLVLEYGLVLPHIDGNKLLVGHLLVTMRRANCIMPFSVS
jgi:hypothetical protein